MIGAAASWRLYAVLREAGEALRSIEDCGLLRAEEQHRDLDHMADAIGRRAVQYILEAVTRGLEMPLDKGQFLEATLFGLSASTDDMREGTAAFLEKRAPAFKGR